MLVTVYYTPVTGSAETERQLHFETVPLSGERVEIEGEFYHVVCAWHVPSDRLTGAKAALIVRKPAVRDTGPRLGFWERIGRRHRAI